MQIKDLIKDTEWRPGGNSSDCHPEVSVLLPVEAGDHNNLLHKSVNSILSQTLKNLELIVIDDGSKTPLDLSIFNDAPKNIDCVLLINKIPKGGNFARNRGIKMASSEYIAFLDDDDEFFIEKIERIQQAILTYPETDIFYHLAKIQMVNEGLFYYSKLKEFNNEDVFKNLLIGNFIGGTPMTVIKKKSLMDVDCFDEKMPALQDYDLWLRMAKKKMKFKFLDLALTKYNYVTKKKTVSKSFTANKKAKGLIKSKFIADYNKLSKYELSKHDAYMRNNFVHRAILNNQIKRALKIQYKQLLCNINFTNLLKLFAILLGPKFIFKMKSKGF